MGAPHTTPFITIVEISYHGYFCNYGDRKSRKPGVVVVFQMAMHGLWTMAIQVGVDPPYTSGSKVIFFF